MSDKFLKNADAAVNVGWKLDSAAAYAADRSLGEFKFDIGGVIF